MNPNTTPTIDSIDKMTAKVIDGDKALNGENEEVRRSVRVTLTPDPHAPGAFVSFLTSSRVEAVAA